MRKRQALATAFAIASALALCACAPKPALDADSSGGGEKPAAQTAWSPDSDCSACHPDQADAQTLASKAHGAANVGCTFCHKEQDLESVHAEHGDSGRTPTKLRYTKVDDAGCLTPACHDSLDALVAASSGIQVSDAYGTSKNPHEMMGQKGHENMTCTDCHSLHADQDVKAQAQTTCFGCHHARKFECGTCHA